VPYPKRPVCKRGHAKEIGKNCKVCQRENIVRWQEEHGGREYANAKRRQQKEKIAGRPRPEICEVCGGVGRICFDHDHATGIFRGWLCSHCNTVLGLTEDNPERLLKLALYLEKHRAK
jgi:hypothetical protein